MDRKTLLLCGGGTGGHIYPAVAIAREMEREAPDWRVIYAGTPGGLEADLIPREGLPFFPVRGGGILGKRPLALCRGLARTMGGVGDARRLLREQRPSLVLGTGGYASFPVLLAAWREGIPCMIHEQNAHPGMANRIANLWAVRTLITFPASAGGFWRRRTLVHTGLPVRREFVRSAGGAAGGPANRLLVTGGSQGSRQINGLVLDALPALLAAGWHVTVITGPREYESFLSRLSREAAGSSRLEVLAYSGEMPALLARTTLAVSRAGASFLAELNAAGVPAILLPLESAAGNHQFQNARCQEEAGAARIFGGDSGEALAGLIGSLDGTALAAMAACSRGLGAPDAAETIARLVRETAEGGIAP